MKRRGASVPRLCRLLIAVSVAALAVHAAPTALSTTESDGRLDADPPPENVIRSIGFRYCSPSSKESDNTSGNAIQLSNLALAYDRQSNTISLQADGSTEGEFDATSAYDRVVYDQTIMLAKVVPPIPHFSFQETFPAPSLLPEQLPKVLFSLPAVEALASIQLYDAQGNLGLCTSIPLTNTLSANSPAITIASVSLTAAAIALTAISSILAMLTSAAALTSVPLAAASSATSGANPSSGISPSVFDVISFCQFIATSGSLNLEYPEILQQWTQNFGWSIGLISSERWNRAINDLRARTTRGDTTEGVGMIKLSSGAQNSGGRLLTAPNSTTRIESVRSMIGRESQGLKRRQIATKIATRATVTPTPTRQPGEDMLLSLQDSSLMNRIEKMPHLRPTEPPSTSPFSPQPSLHPSWHFGSHHLSPNSLGQPGLASFGQRLNIPPENMFMTSLFFLLILLLGTSLVALVLRTVLEGYAYFRPGKFTKLRRRFSSYYVGNMLRVALFAYFAVATMAFYQFTLKDSWAITLIAVITLLIFLVLVSYITYKLRRAGGTSLFFDERLKSKYGPLYDHYVLSAYWFFVPVLVYQILKAAIVGLGHGSPSNNFDHHGSSDSWAQISLLLLVEVCFAALQIWKRPFADKTTNHLNSTLSFVRVLNVVMLAVLIEGTSVSTVSRTVVGVVIAGTQLLMMLVLACLVFYQLGRVLWKLRSSLRAMKQAKMCKKAEGLDLSDSDDILDASSKDEQGQKKDYNDKNQEPQGRIAGEHSRSGGGSMTSLVGMMGIGSNPTIHCTPASDDEDDGLEAEGGDYVKELTPSRFQDSARIQDSTLHEPLHKSTHDADARSSFILDYYNLACLQSTQHKSPMDELESKAQDMAEDLSQKRGIGSTGDQQQANLTIPQVAQEEPWIQSAYMTRRRHSESNASHGQRQSGSHAKVHDIRKTASFSQAPEHSNKLSNAANGNDTRVDNHLQQRRRRPFSLGAARQGLAPATFYTSVPESRRQLLRSGLGSRQDVFPTFRGTYIPQSLLVGPPPPSSIQPRRISVSSATLATPPSMSPILHVGDGFGAFSSLPLTEEGSEQGSIMSTPTTLQPIGIPYFEEYRFPDERAPQVAPPQQAIHPLSPQHQDFQHPDDIYNATMLSPNEEGPASASLNASSAGVYDNVPNAPQDGRDSRRESRLVGHDATLSTASSSSHSTVFMTPVNSKKRPGPGLRIVTTLQSSTPPPRIPIPMLPLTPLTANLSLEATSKSTAARVDTKSEMEAGVSSSLTPMLTAISTITTDRSNGSLGSIESSSGVVECTLATSSQSGTPPRQRALTMTPRALPGRPLTVSSVHRDARPAR
ncbi:hypothetical protein BGX31_003320 [Mortierella sp. GBA43]|nr:hypothetical protein BGX31_003320 [Mortierella sp. GBA43]